MGYCRLLGRTEHTQLQAEHLEGESTHANQKVALTSSVRDASGGQLNLMKSYCCIIQEHCPIQGGIDVAM